MLYSSAATLFLCLSSAFVASAAPIAYKSRSRRNLAVRQEAQAWPDNMSDGEFGVPNGKSDGKTSDIRKQGEGKVLVGKYPEGSYAGANIAGFQFNAKTNVDLSNAKEVQLTYQVKFEEGFDFALAGKLPGLFGGDDFGVAGTCAGGNHDDKCWSARLMWRDHGKGELYGYFPSPNKGHEFCHGQCDKKYGASLGTGNWKFTPGKWGTLTERIRLNDKGKFNGEIEVSFNKESVFTAKGIMLRTSDKSKFAGVMVHTFFGGSSSPDFASPKSQEALFRDFHVEVLQEFGGKSENNDEDEPPKNNDEEPPKNEED